MDVWDFEEDIKELYFEDGLSADQIADYLGLSRQEIVEFIQSILFDLDLEW